MQKNRAIVEYTPHHLRKIVLFLIRVKYDKERQGLCQLMAGDRAEPHRSSSIADNDLLYNIIVISSGITGIIRGFSLQFLGKN